MNNTITPPHKQELWGHPKGLYILFLTELWERFSYYGMRAILVLYITAAIGEGGMGWSNADGLALYGWYTMLVYVMSIPGGILADRVFGQKKTVMLGGALLVAGHGILAVDAEWAFFTGLALIVLGVGGLKPNISTMVGGLYPKGDIRRDKGFTIFYIGINVGAFLSSIVVALVAAEYGWHYGFGLAGIGMLLGQLFYIWGQRFLVGVGDYVEPEKIEGSTKSKPLTKIEKDRVIVLLLSFIIIIVFWGAFEQAGGLMNIYANDKINRVIGVLNYEVPAGVFQSVNAFFIMIFGTLVAAYWAKRKLKGKESSSIFKMAIGTMIMGLGFLFMTVASVEAGSEPFGKGAMVWLIAAYLLHTIGELCSSPVSLSFITKLAPVKYASIMMGVYFAATGFGNKLAGTIGEASQSEPIEIELQANSDLLATYAADSIFEKEKNFNIKTVIYTDGSNTVIKDYESSQNITSLYTIDGKNGERLAELIDETSETSPMHATLAFDKKKEAEGKKDYKGTIVVEEVQNAREKKTFTYIAIFTVAFGLLLVMFLKKLKALTHGAEDNEREITNEEATVESH